VSQINRELELTIQAAAREAVRRRHAFLTVEHLLYALIHDERGEEVLRHAGARVERLSEGLERFFDEELEKLPEETGRLEQTLAFHRVMQAALQHAESAEKEEVEAGDLLAAIFQEPDSHATQLLRAQGVTRLDVLRYLSHGVSKLSPGGAGGATEGAGAPGPGSEWGEDGVPGDPLEAFAEDLTARAKAGELDPLVGRETELERSIHILARRRKNNPIYVGETGVGKTALAEGLAQRIVSGDVPDHLREAEIFSLDLGAMLAGTRYRGDFEERFKALIAAVRERAHPILFIDEIHTILGAGSAQGATVDASSMLKPLLASGELRCMGSTTYQEFRHFERDRALARRFQRVDVREPSSEESLKILQGLAPRYEEHHGVNYTPSALKGAVDLSVRHLTDRFLPDKAIDVLDEVGAAVRLGAKKKKTVGLRDVEGVVARMAGIPTLRATGAERVQLEGLDEDLRAVVFGQDPAVSTVVRAIKRARAGLGGSERPTGSFLFVGPTGVGKTELARQLAASLQVPFFRFDMSEYMEKHAVARLIGAPPGYVGYDEGGQLVDKVRKSPHSVVLLDEIEKAHGDLFDILLQVMDHATLTDNHGREADFRHVVLIMTSNAGARERAERRIGFVGGRKTEEGDRAVDRLFSPEFRNRLDEIVRFVELSPEVMGRVVDKFVAELETQLSERKVRVELTPAGRAWLAERGYDTEFGARPLARVIQAEVKDRISDEVLFGALQRGGSVRIDGTPGADQLALEFTGA
jgi:ATP-dependent Clp protease ATP-binding subunit ClpA